MGFGDRLVNAWHIFRTSLEFIGRDKSLLVIPVLMVLTTIAFCIVFFLSVFAPRVGGALVFNFAIFLLVMYIINTFFAAAQSWMVHEVAEGKDTTVMSGIGRALKNIADILAFAVVMMLIKMFVSGLRRKGGIAGRITGGFLELITGILGKLVLPAMIVTERSFVQAITQMKHSIKVVPEIATFEVGIRPLTGLVTWIGLGIGALLFFGGLKIAGIVFFGIWLLAVILFSMLINQIYYTLLYITLIERRRVPGLSLHR